MPDCYITIDEAMIYDYHENTGSPCPLHIAYHVAMAFSDQTLGVGLATISRGFARPFGVLQNGTLFRALYTISAMPVIRIEMILYLALDWRLDGDMSFKRIGNEICEHY